METACPTVGAYRVGTIRPVFQALVVWASLLNLPALALATEQGRDNSVPSFAELEAAEATIGEIHILNQDIFDLTDENENNWLFRLANTLHIQTKPGVIARELLFKRGDKLSARAIEETERLLRSHRYFYDVRLRPIAYHDGVVDIEVQTRDTWSLDPGISFSRSGGSNTSGIKLREYNLLGTGIGLGFSHSRNVDRSSNEFQFQYDRAIDGWTSLGLTLANNSDGKRQAISVVRPFYALDARWAAGVYASRDDRIDAVYTAGAITSRYRHKQDISEVSGGWSDGLIGGSTQRYSVGLLATGDTYRFEPGLVAPPLLPKDQKIAAPFVRYEVIEEHYEKIRNRNQMGRPEFFALGFASTVQLSRALGSLGSSDELWLYSASISKGFEPYQTHELLLSAALNGQYDQGRVKRQLLSATARYYLPLTPRFLLYASVGADTLTNPNPLEQLNLGGDNGLRGYPLRYQNGDHRALATLEARAFSDLYLFHLFRVGGAAFYDVGRAWGGVSGAKPEWLQNAGFGLRIFSVRAAFGNVLHLDLAMPLNGDPGIKSLQFLVKTKTSF